MKFTGFIFCLLGMGAMAFAGEREEQDAIALKLAREKKSGPSEILPRGKGAAGEYLERLRHAVGSRWFALTKEVLDLGGQTVRVEFTIDRDGRIVEPKVEDLSGNSTEKFREICLKSVREVKLAPPPAAALADSPSGIRTSIRFRLEAPVHLDGARKPASAPR